MPELDRVERIKCKINELRKKLIQLINEKQNLLDPDVVSTSQQLDDVLNEYNKMMNEDSKSSEWLSQLFRISHIKSIYTMT